MEIDRIRWLMVRLIQHFSTICSTVTAIGEPVAKMLRIH